MKKTWSGFNPPTTSNRIDRSVSKKCTFANRGRITKHVAWTAGIWGLQAMTFETIQLLICIDLKFRGASLKAR